MYKRNAQGWSKHLDFIILDEVMLMLSFLLAMLIRHGRITLDQPIYGTLLFVLALADIAAIVVFNFMHDVLKRGYAKELSTTFKLVLAVFLIATGYMFSTQTAEAYSRLTLYYTSAIHLLLGYGARVLYKRILKTHGNIGAGKRSMLAVLKEESAEEMIQRLQQNPAEAYHLVGVVLDAPTEKTEIENVPVVSDLDNAADYICRQWIDSVYIDCPSENPKIRKLMDACREMAVPVHYHIPGVSRHKQKQFVERIGGSTVLTLSNNYATPVQLFLKRIVDIAGGLVGSLLALIIMAVIGPMIKHASPGPVLYTSERIGQNGKHFRMYKIRSMIPNAEAKKQSLQSQNTIEGGMMFKLDWDPRIIGNTVLPDGTRKTGIGEFIRKTSLDEFPQFFNVLRGEMSLVGTRLIIAHRSLGASIRKLVHMDRDRYVRALRAEDRAARRHVVALCFSDRISARSRAQHKAAAILERARRAFADRKVQIGFQNARIDAYRAAVRAAVPVIEDHKVCGRLRVEDIRRAGRRGKRAPEQEKGQYRQKKSLHGTVYAKKAKV